VSAPDTRGPAPLTGPVALLVLIAVVVGGVLLTQAGGGPGAGTSDGGDGGPAPGAPAARPAVDTGLSEAERVYASTTALLAFERAVRTEREDLFDRVFAAGPGSSAGPGSAEAGDALFTSLRRLPLSAYSLRYVDEAGHRGRTWRADVEVQWGLRGVDRRPATSEIEVTFTGRGPGGARITSMAPAEDAHAPVWLLGPLQVQRVDGAWVLSLQPPLTAGVTVQARQAVTDVRRVLEGWPGGLVVVLPRTTAQLEQMLNARPGSYAKIAAVTASADGGGDPSAPVRVLLNPPVFTGLGPIAGQVVLSHEATHAATGATYRDMPLWLVEGFADYVALAREPVPLKVAAGQALQQVRRHGPPSELPDADDFATSAHGLGASYEAAWLACRLVAQRYGEDALLHLYRQVARTGDVGAAFEQALGTDVDSFTAQWQDHLRRLAG
jgi:hypothetical protein